MVKSVIIWIVFRGYIEDGATRPYAHFGHFEDFEVFDKV